MKWIKAHWREILIVLLLIMFMSKCTSSGNYKRKYNRQVEYTEYAIDSLKGMYGKSAKTIDSLTVVIDKRDAEIKYKDDVIKRVQETSNAYKERGNAYREQKNDLKERNTKLEDTINKERGQNEQYE